MTSVATSSFLQGGGELGKLIRAKDWSRTAVGSPETWPQSLRTAVSLCLASRFPINILWGPEAIQIYNDGYRVCCGDAHPRALGEDYRITWASAWPVIGESFERAAAGETMFLENQRMFLRRLPGGGLEEAFFTFSHSPIRDESGGIGGLFHPVTETTATMLAERRTRALRDLAANLSLATDEAEVGRRTVEILSDFESDLPFLLYYQLDIQDGNYRLTVSHGVEAGLPVTPLEIGPGSNQPWPFGEALSGAASAWIVEVNLVPALMEGRPCGPYEEAPARAFMLPVAVPGLTSPPAVLIAGASSRLRMDVEYRSFYRLLGVTVVNALVVVRAREDERRRAEALAEIDRAKTLFFSNVSHEFRTPLTLMLGPLEEMLRRAPVASESRQHLVVAHRNGLRLLKLVNALLDFSRVEAGRAQASYQATDLAALTAEIASNFRSACESAGLALTIHCPPLLEPVFLDRDMWEKVVLNLISNAFKFTFKGEIVVAVRMSEDQATAVLTVTDTGIGIAREELPRVFERFHRVESARGRTHEGTGIGLALVQELVRLHGGTVEVESTPGRGTAFTVRLPFGKEHLPADRIDAHKSMASTATHAEAFVEEARRWLPQGVLASSPPAPLREGLPHVLLVEDNADMRDYVHRLLEPRYRVETATNGEVALEAIGRCRPDLILADVMMPRLDGIGLLKAVRGGVPSVRDLPVVLLSARAGEEAKVEGLEAGADDYLIKPFSAQELLARVAANINMARLRWQAERTRVLVEELQHRTRNLMGVVRSIADKTLRSSADLGDFAARFRDRLEVLSRVQSLLSRLDEHDRVTFDELIRTELAAMNGESERVTFAGPVGVRLRSSSVQTLALALHELATNAVKYGALGQQAARLAISWTLETSHQDGKPWLHILWKESGVKMPPPAVLARGTGQGRELIEQALPYQLGGYTSYAFELDGVRCAIAIPVSVSTTEYVCA